MTRAPHEHDITNVLQSSIIIYTSSSTSSLMSSPQSLPVMLSVSAAARRPGVCAKTIRRWDAGGQLHCLRTPSGHRRVSLVELERALSSRAVTTAPTGDGQQHGLSPPTATTTTADTRTTAVYARVSSHRQARDGDLTRQQELLVRMARRRHSGSGTPLVFTDIASGLNMRRRGLLRLLRTARQGLIHTVLVTHRD